MAQLSFHNGKSSGCDDVWQKQDVETSPEIVHKFHPTREKFNSPVSKSDL